MKIICLIAVVSASILASAVGAADAEMDKPLLRHIVAPREAIVFRCVIRL